MAALKKLVISWMPCDRPGCGEAFILKSNKLSQRFCSQACAKTPKVPYPREMYHSGIYRSWTDMKTRCLNKNRDDYPRYGGRGIKIYEPWLHFGNFLKDMGQTHRDGLTLDRIDSNGDYCPENCQWITIQKQQSNRRDTRVAEYMGEKRTVREWSEELGIKFSTLRGRYYTTGDRDISKCLERAI